MSRVAGDHTFMLQYNAALEKRLTTVRRWFTLKTTNRIAADQPARTAQATVHAPPRDARPVHLAWLDYMKAIALIWIFINHVSEQLFRFPYFANPSASWPPLDQRIEQLQPLSSYGWLNVPFNILRYVGWTGDQGVQLFLIVSGFGLTWGLLKRGQTVLDWSAFYRRRMWRLYPLWLAAHAFFVLGVIALPVLEFPPLDGRLLLSALGIRLTSDILYYPYAAWWYIGLLIQLYLVFPLLFGWLRRAGPLKFLVATAGISLLVRAAGLLVFDAYLDAWSRGAIFITRLPEFAFGMSLAVWMHDRPVQVTHMLSRRTTVLAAIGLYAIGILLSLTLLGMTVAPFLVGIAAFVVLYAVLNQRTVRFSIPRLADAGAWIGKNSYALYLVHHPAIVILIPAGLAADSLSMPLRVAAALAATLVGALVLQAVVTRVETTLGAWAADIGPRRTALRVAFIVVVMAGIAFGAEFLVRQSAPQEISGWGERPSLEPHPVLGWRLKPSTETRLRWESYDYTVTANSLGFPGAEYAGARSPGSFRILVTGDAFTSAEGVDTGAAWPRLLENQLAQTCPDCDVEVMNFGITGYGPNQYAAVVETYAPEYRPDLIIIAFFVNDYGDVLVSNEEFQSSIGFDRPDQSGPGTFLQLQHLRRWLELQLYEPLLERVRQTPRPHGYFLGYFRYLKPDESELWEDGRDQVAERLEQIKRVADDIGAPVMLLMIPAPVQVCTPDDLAYFPRYVDLDDPAQFDRELPQRVTEALAGSLGIDYYDLRPALELPTGACPYQRHNSHWTAEGHRAVAGYVAELLSTDERIFAPNEEQ